MEIISGIDEAAAGFFASLPVDGALCFVMRAFSFSVDYGAILLALCAWLLISKKTRFSGLCVTAALIICFIVCNVALKPLVHRARPFEVYPDFAPLIPPPGDFSFPSAHTAASFAAASTVFKAFSRKWGACALGFALMVALSRLYLRVHFLTDIVSGALIGVICSASAVFALQALRRFYTRRRLRQ